MGGSTQNDEVFISISHKDKVKQQSYRVRWSKYPFPL